MCKKVLIVGAGPIGIEVAAALKVSGIDYRHLEAGCLASTISWWAPGTTIFSSPERLAIADMPFKVYPDIKASKEDYLNYLRTVVEKYRLDIEYFRRVVSIRKSEDKFSVKIAFSNHGVGGPMEYSGASAFRTFEEAEFSKLILAIGDMQLPRELGIEGERQANVSHFLSDPHEYFGTTVCIVGARNSAAEAAVRLGRIGARVIWCCRNLDLENSKIKPWLLPDLKGLIKEKVVTLHNFVEIRKIEGNRGSFIKGQESFELEADKFLLLTGYRQDNTLYRQLGINLIGDSMSPEHKQETMETNVPGVYVAGTGIAGSQIGGAKIFIENCHAHSNRIARALGSTVPLFGYREERSESEREQ